MTQPKPPAGDFDGLPAEILPTPQRSAEIAGRIAALREEIGQAAESCGRDADSVKIVAVTKTFPASDLTAVLQAGLVDVGENRVQEWASKLDAFAPTSLAKTFRWHYIGQLQTNKAAAVAAAAHLVHSVDRLSLVKALNKGAIRADRRVGCLMQLSLDGQTHRGGVPIADWQPVADAIADSANLDLCGVMAVAPKGSDPEAAFAQVHEVAREVQAAHPAASIISTGMSGDFVQAIAHGSTHVRVGASLLGARPVVG